MTDGNDIRAAILMHLTRHGSLPRRELHRKCARPEWTTSQFRHELDGMIERGFIEVRADGALQLVPEAKEIVDLSIQDYATESEELQSDVEKFLNGPG